MQGQTDGHTLRKVSFTTKDDLKTHLTVDSDVSATTSSN
uniref:Uncharacterized protein n=1 Tax=Anguilla anguilla TaxID=7936 RepID=A0A0E9Q8K2_ANGAN